MFQMSHKQSTTPVVNPAYESVVEPIRNTSDDATNKPASTFTEGLL